MDNVEITKNVFEMMTDITNDFINRAYVVPPVNSYMVKKIGENRYIVFVLKEFTVFKITFKDKCFNITMKDGVTVQIDIKEKEDMFELHGSNDKNTSVHVPEPVMLEEFLKTVRTLCRIEKRSQVPHVRESRQVLGYNVTRKNII